MSDRLIDLPEVLALTSLRRSTLYERVRNNQFPAPVNLGGRRVAWIEKEVSEWISERIQERSVQEKRS